MEADLIVYKSIIDESSSMLLFKIFAKNKESKLDILHYTRMIKTI